MRIFFRIPTFGKLGKRKSNVHDYARVTQRLITVSIVVIYPTLIHSAVIHCTKLEMKMTHQEAITLKMVEYCQY